MRGIALLLGTLALAPVAAHAQQLRNYYPTTSTDPRNPGAPTVVTGCAGSDGSGNPIAVACPVAGTSALPPTSSTPIAVSATIGTTPTRVFVASATRHGWTWQAQGAGYACVSWSSATPSAPSVNSSAATCAVGSLVGPLFSDASKPGVIAATAFYATAYAAGALTINGEDYP